ncbi:MAG: radical SAM protein, partial [Pseudomonadota bacterium]
VRPMPWGPAGTLYKGTMEDGEPMRAKSDCLSVEVTTRCNSSCTHCFVRARKAGRVSFDPDLVRTLVREGYEIGYRRLHITGGEPLLWGGLLGILDYAFGLGYRTTFLNTNGTLLTAGMARELSAYDGLAVSVSLEGPRSLHDRVRGDGSYESALQGIDNALNAGLPVYIFTTVRKSLLGDLPSFADGVFRAFPDLTGLIFIQLIRVREDVLDLSGEVLDPDDFLRLVRTVSLLNLYGLKADILNNPLASAASKLLKMPWLPRSQPLYQPGSVMITADRRVTLAHSTMDDFGMYEPGVLGSIIDSDAYGNAVSEDSSFCGDCVHSRLCAGEGMVRPSEWFRDMVQDVPYCKRVLALASSNG